LNRFAERPSEKEDSAAERKPVTLMGHAEIVAKSGQGKKVAPGATVDRPAGIHPSTRQKQIRGEN